MTKREKIRDAILGISDKKIESTDMCYRPRHVESGDTLEDKRRKQIVKWGDFGSDEIVVCAYETGAFGSIKKGVVFTEDVLWEKGAFDVAKQNRNYLNPLRYADICDVHWSAKKSSYFMIQLENTEVEIYASIFAKFYAEALKRAVEAAGYTMKKNVSKKKAEATVEEKNPAEKNRRSKKTAEKPSATKHCSVSEVDVEANDINARIAAIECELNILYNRRAELEAEETARKAAEEAARKAAEEAARKAAEETARKAAEEAARKTAEEAAAIEELDEEDDLFEENEEIEIAREYVLDGRIEEAIQHYERAADAGDCDAMCELGNLYGDDIEMDRNVEKAFYWYDLADRHGDILGAVFAADLAIEIAQTLEDLKIAEGWISRAEAKGQHKNAKNQRNKLMEKQRKIEQMANARNHDKEAATRRAVEEAARKTAEEAARKVAEEAAAQKAAEEAAKKKQKDDRDAEIAKFLEEIRAEHAANKTVVNKERYKQRKKPQGKPLTEKTFEELTAYQLTQLIRMDEYKNISRSYAKPRSVDEEINMLEKEIILEFDKPLEGITGALLEQILVGQHKMDADHGTFYGMGGYLGRKYEELKAEGPTDHSRTQIERCVTVLNYILLSLQNTDRHLILSMVADSNRWNENRWNSWQKRLIRYYTEMRARFIRLYY